MARWLDEPNELIENLSKTTVLKSEEELMSALLLGVPYIMGRNQNYARPYTTWGRGWGNEQYSRIGHSIIENPLIFGVETKMQTQVFAEKFANKVGIDIAMIQMIIEAIMQIFQNCPQSRSSLKLTVKNPTLFQRARATNIVMQKLDGVSRSRARQIARELLEEASNAEESLVESVVEECCNENVWS